MARPVRVIFDHLRCSSPAGRDLRCLRAIGELLQYFDFSCPQGLHQNDAFLESDLETSQATVKLAKECTGSLKKEAIVSGPTSHVENLTSPRCRLVASVFMVHRERKVQV